MKGVNEIAFAGPVRADEIGQRAERHVTLADASIVAQDDAGDER